MALLAAEFDSGLEENAAKDALETLTKEYPGHSWKVMARGGVLFIKYLHPSLRGNWGMNIKLHGFDHDAAVLKRKVKFVAGEFLERASVLRSAFQGDSIKRVDGIPDKWQPI